MMYISTRGYDKKFTSAEAIKQGIAPDGGLFVPETIPQLSKAEIMGMTETAPPISSKRYFPALARAVCLFLMSALPYSFWFFMALNWRKARIISVTATMNDSAAA